MKHMRLVLPFITLSLAAFAGFRDYQWLGLILYPAGAFAFAALATYVKTLCAEGRI